MGHDVAWLKVQMGDAVFLQVAQGLRYGPDEVELGIKRKGLFGAQDIIAEIGRGYVVYQQVIFIEIVLLGQQVILGQEHRQPEFDLGEDESLMGHPALPADLPLLPLDDDILLQRPHSLKALLDDHSSAIRPNVPVLYLR